MSAATELRPSEPPTGQAPATATAGAAVRLHDSVLVTVERRALTWLAERMPRRVNSDHLTALGLLAMIGVGLSYWLASVTPLGLVLATALLAVNWFGDSLDGTLARARRQQRPRYGYYVDHVCDAIGIAALVGGLGLSGFMRPWVAASLLLAYYLLSLEVYLAAHSLGRFRLSFFKMGPTELRLLLATGNMVLLLNPTASVLGGALSLFDVGGVVAAVGLVATFLYSAIGNGRQLYRDEPLPPSPAGERRSGRGPRSPHDIASAQGSRVPGALTPAAHHTPSTFQ